MLLCDVIDPVGELKMVLGVKLGKKCKDGVARNILYRSAPVVYTPKEHKGRR